ncbi:MAG: glycerophosphodiester phosphodiesterase [Deltaproteobacteria bacterium]|nr:glycerophosphodiester phosphodiesterase [Deltaproteobacteria bacterium]
MSIGPREIITHGIEAIRSKISSDRWVTHNPRPRTQFPIEEKMLVLGHRGARGVAPENTMAGFEVCSKLGVGFELDTQLCASGEPVVFHDDTLNRCTNGSGYLYHQSLKQLKKLDAGSHFSPEFCGETIPTLGEVLETYGKSLVVDIEIKDESFNNDPRPLVDAVFKEIDKRNLHDRVSITSFNPEVLWLMRERCPEILRGQIYYSFEDTVLPVYQREFLRNLGFNSQTKPDWLVPRHLMVNQDYVGRYQSLGYRVSTWTVNHPGEMRRLLNLGVDSIITDYPATLKKVVEEHLNDINQIHGKI